MFILLVLTYLFWFVHVDVGPGGHEADAAQKLVDKQVEEGWPRRHYWFNDPEAGETKGQGRV
jgi:hypothetical protein